MANYKRAKNPGAIKKSNLGGAIKPRTSPIIQLAVFLFLTAILTPAMLSAKSQPELVIFFTGDVHGQALPQWDKSGNLTNIGYPIFKAYVDSSQAKNKMLLDSGGLLSGRPFADIQHGLLAARLAAPIEYDAISVGNHDFDFGVPRLMELATRYELNFTAANIRKKEDGSPLFPAYVIKDYKGLKVGIFGLSTPATPTKTSPGNVATLDFGQPDELEKIARDQVAKLRQEGAGLIIALTHLGTSGDNKPTAQDIAKTVPGIDLIIDGHSHSELPGLKINNTLIVSAGSYFTSIGMVEVSLNSKGKPILTSKLIPATEAGRTPPDQKLDALAATTNAEFRRDMEHVATTLPYALEGDPQITRLFSTSLGRLICAAMKRATGADVAIINSGAIGAGLPAGEVTWDHLLKVFTTNNYVMTVRLSGAEIIETLNHGLSQGGQSGFPQFYGMTVTAIELKAKTGEEGTQASGGRADIIEIGGRLLEPEAEYTVAITDFLYGGGDGYHIFSNRPAHEYAPIDGIFLKFLSEAGRETLDYINLDDVLTVLVEE